MQFIQDFRMCQITSVVSLCDPMGCSLPGSSVHGILQARRLEWDAVSFSRGSSRPRNRTQVSCIAGRFFTNQATGEAPSLLKFMSIWSVTLSNHLILCRPLLLLPSISPASGSFAMSQFFPSGGQSFGVSALNSVFPMNIQDQFPLGLTGWISFQSKGLSRVFSNATVQKDQFFSTQLSL